MIVRVFGTKPILIAFIYTPKFVLEWIRGMWANCPNVGSPVSLGLFEGENKSKYFQKSLPQLCM